MIAEGPLPEKEENMTLISPMFAEHADSPSTLRVATLARPRVMVEHFCGIGEIGPIGAWSSRRLPIKGQTNGVRLD